MVLPPAPIPPPVPCALPAALVRALRLAVLGLVAVAGIAPGTTSPGLALAAVESAPSLGSVRFAPGGARIPADARTLLDRVASRLATDGTSRVELLAYASGSNENSRARRLSLDRALAVRGYLAARGVAQFRMLLRALGNRRTGGDGDCVVVVTLD